MEDDVVVNKRQAASLCGFSVATLDRLLARDAFPRRTRLSPGRVGFWRSEVLAWVSARPKVPPRKPEPPEPASL